jgi:hypothetical protein
LRHGEKKKARQLYSSKGHNSIEDLVGNEENEYQVPDPKKTMTNITNELNDVHKKISQRKKWKRSLRYSRRIYKR